MKSNKSRTYLLPLLAKQTGISFDEYCNTFLNTSEFDRKYLLHLVYENTQNIHNFRKLEEELINSYCCVSINNQGTSLILSFELDEEYHEAYDLFVKGKYSYFPSTTKDLILRFWGKRYNKTNKKFLIQLKNILDRSPVLRRELETKLGVEIDPEMDLSSSIYIENETYVF